jgi:hypothetical protein
VQTTRKDDVFENGCGRSPYDYYREEILRLKQEAGTDTGAATFASRRR